MSKSAWLAVIAAMLASSPSFAQFGGAGGMGGGMGGMGGGMGEQGYQANMMQGGRRAQAHLTEAPRSARVEMEGGQMLSGKIELRPVVVDSDLGQYEIPAHNIKMIRFLKPANEANPRGGNEATKEMAEEPGAADMANLVREKGMNRAAMRMARMGGGGFGMVNDPSSRTGMATLVRGKVLTTSGQEVIGMIHIPTDFTLELDFGSLVLAAAKLRSITFAAESQKDKPAQAAPSSASSHEKAPRPARAHESSPPRYFRQGSSIVVISPTGDHVTLYNVDSKKSTSIALGGSDETRLDVSPIVIGDLVALMVKGPKITRIAVGNMASGTWHSQDLREPLDGDAVPIVAPGVAVYAVGQNVYAYSAESDRWDVAELPPNVRAAPVVSPGTATIESDGHIYKFTAHTGKWGHIDVREIP